MTKITPEFLDSPEFVNLLKQFPKVFKKYLTNGQYLTGETPDKAIILHHTAGLTAAGAWEWWNQTPERVGVAYIIDRNGQIWECFDPTNWAYHLGIPKDNHGLEKASIGIEIVSAGHLYPDAHGVCNQFMPLYPNKAGAHTITDNIVTFEEPYRGHKVFHGYTDEQIINLCQLIADLKSRFPGIEIPKILPEKFYEFDASVAKQVKGGIWSHTTVRLDKDDIFPQVELLLALKKTCDLISTEPVVKSKPTNTPGKVNTPAFPGT